MFQPSPNVIGYPVLLVTIAIQRGRDFNPSLI